MKTEITIKPLSYEFNQDYLDFFDHRAFSDNHPNGPCYCTSPNQDENDIKEMVNHFKTNGIKETLRLYAKDMLDKGIIHGYLAFDKEVSIGWCNVYNRDSYKNFVPKEAYDVSCGKTLSIVCFEIAPEYRGMGIASQFIDYICSDAKKQGYDVVEGYPIKITSDDSNDFYGPMKLYEKAGFYEIEIKGDHTLMRKDI